MTFKENVAINNGVFIPSTISPSSYVSFAIDNTRQWIDTPDGQWQFHGTAISTYQQKNYRTTISYTTQSKSWAVTSIHQHFVLNQ